MELDSIWGELLLISIFNTWVSKNCLSPTSTPTPLPLVHQVVFIFLFTLQTRMVYLKADMCGWLDGEQRVVRNCRRTISASTYFLIGIPLYSAETYGIICWDLGASFIAPSGLNSAYTIVIMNRSTILVYVPLFLLDLKMKFYSALSEEVGYKSSLYYFEMKQINFKSLRLCLK